MKGYIRPAEPADHGFYTRLFPDLLTPDEPPVHEKFVMDMVPSAFVLEVDGAPVGFGYVQVLGAVGYVRQILVDPAHRGRGFGRALMRECVRRFRAEHCSEWCLNVKPDNVPAVTLYRSLGLQQVYESIAVRIDWDRVEDLPAAEGEVVEPAAEQARLAERVFGLPDGLVGKQLAHPGRVVRIVLEDDAVAGLATFDPTFPGCFPFRARSAPHMRALLDGLRPARRPEHPDIQLVFEDAEDLARALEHAGGRRTMSFVHLRGRLAEA